jgi:hypothetical protein
LACESVVTLQGIHPMKSQSQGSQLQKRASYHRSCD